MERKLSSKEEALLVATACSKPPPGRARWTLELLADEMVRLTDHEELSSETVRRRLAENHLKPWRKDMWCIPKVDGEYVARMEDVLDLYAETPDPQRPVVCFDESPTQLIGEVREPIPAKPGQLERYDCEYRRNGTVNLFVFLDAHRPWRRVKVTDRRTNQDFAECMRELVDIDYPDAPIIRVVMDNLSTHSAGALYDAFPAPEARRVLKRLQFHHTPKHASWLNMVEIEIGVLRSQCLDRRIDDKETILAEVAAWQQRRNAEGAQLLSGATRAAAFSMRPCGGGEGLLGGFLDQVPINLLEQAGAADVAFGPRDVSRVRARLIEDAGRITALLLPLRRRERPFPGGVVEDRTVHAARKQAVGLGQVAGLELLGRDTARPAARREAELGDPDIEVLGP